MEVAGLVLGIVPLVLEVVKLRDLIKRLQLNPKRTKDLAAQVDGLVKILETASNSSNAADKLVRASLQEVSDTLESLKPEARKKMGPFPKFVAGCIAASGEADKLDEVQSKLTSLTSQVVTIKSIFQLKEEFRGVYKGPIHLPECKIGLERAEDVLDFLRSSVDEKLRVVGIHGLPGLGKSTLLHRVWNEASSTAPFASQALIQIGQSVKDSQICKLQSTILQQLGGERDVKFTVPDSGKAKLSMHLQKLRDSKKPIFLAIDNVFEAEGLRKILPDTLANDIPGSSVIVLTTRRFTICEELLRISHLSRDNVAQVHLLKPDLLGFDESKTMFAASGELSLDENVELLESLVPLCGGLPLALTVLGRLFAGKARRSRGEWELIKDQMEKLDGGDTVTGSITKVLQVSFDQFHESRKIAFCELVQCFYGWNWERVERILGVDVLNDLRESSLISEAEHWSKCNQSALREGFDMDGHHINGGPKLVTMHDLVFKFGEGLSTKLSVETMTDLSEKGDFNKLRVLSLRRNFYTGDPLELVTDAGISEIDQYLERAVNLQTLSLCDSSDGNWGSESNLLRATYTNDYTRRTYLRFLRLQRWKTSSSIMEMRLSSEIREIHLIDCFGVERLPDSTSLDALEVLIIERCDNFQSFSPSSVEKWRKLKHLTVADCFCLTSFPNELGLLEQLCDLEIRNCALLGSLPTMACPLRRLYLSDLPITHLDLKETASLIVFKVSQCSRLKRLPSAIAKAFSLQTLMVWYCKSLEELPAEMGKFAALTEVRLESCKGLKVLPLDICNLSSLRKLSLHRWESLVELPNEVGNLAALTDLDLTGWESLKELPRSIGNARSIRRLSLVRCENLVKLPDEVGKLGELTDLTLMACKRLKRLPPAIGNARSIERLCLSRCESLVELPNEVGSISALTHFDLSECKSLTRLPPGIGNARSIKTLLLGGCESLVELPNEVEKLVALQELDLMGCVKLVKLPNAVGKLVALQNLQLAGCENLVELSDEVGKLVALRVLSLNWCESLTELPDEVGKLTALIILSLHECQNLKQLPPGIGNLSSLQTLKLEGCKNLVELPEEMGNLPALVKLNLRDCESLEKLPSAIGNILSLQQLDLRGCKSLTELPDEVGKLAALTYLQLCECLNLKRLPPGIGNFSSLQTLELEGCKNLVELPEEMGNLPALVTLDLRNCESLEKLPSAIGNILSLQYVFLDGCKNLREFPDKVKKLALFRIEWEMYR